MRGGRHGTGMEQRRLMMAANLLCVGFLFQFRRHLFLCYVLAQFSV